MTLATISLRSAAAENCADRTKSFFSLELARYRMKDSCMNGVLGYKHISKILQCLLIKMRVMPKLKPKQAMTQHFHYTWSALALPK